MWKGSDVIVPNAQQQAAARALAGKVLIGAGAGSGKTRTLVDRFVNALGDSAEEGWEPLEVDGILAITFTEKAASEISERVRAALRSAGRPDDARRCDGAWIGTIHGFCSRLLRRYALQAQIDPMYQLLEGASGELMRERAFERACRADTSGVATRLLEEYGYAAVYRAARTIAEQHGSAPTPLSVQPERAGATDALIEDASELMATTRDEVRSCGAAGVRAAALLDACCDTLDVLEALKGTGLESAQQAFAVWEALDRFRPHSGSPAIKETANAAKAAKTELMARAAAVVLAPLCEGLVELALSFEAAYGELKRSIGVLDFEDLQVHTARLLREDASVLETVRSQFGLAMVDEFQDTNSLQLELVSAVAGENLCSVGDAQQSIYRFRGARVEVYRAHREAMRTSGAREFELAVNYRSHADILAFVNHLFEPLFDEGFLALRAGRPEGSRLPDAVPRVEALIVKEPAKGAANQGGRPIEADALANRFAQLRDEFGFAPDEMVVLLGTYRHAQVYADALTSRGFTVSVVGGSRFFSAPEITVVRALLSVIVNPADETALSVLVASDAVGVSATALWTVGSYRREHGESLWDAVVKAARLVEASDSERLDALVDAVDSARARVGAVTLPELIMYAIERLDYDLTLAAGGGPGTDALANVGKLLTLAGELESSGESGPAAFLSALDARERYGEHTTPATDIAPEEGVVQIMSIHSSKGLEFPVVALPELGTPGRGDAPIALSESDGDRLHVSMRLPSTLAGPKSGPGAYSLGYARLKQLNDEAERAEKTRLFYVACTRAREVLLLSGSRPFSAKADASESTPVDWLRRSLADGVEFDGQHHLRRLSHGARCALTMIDAQVWHEQRGGSVTSDLAQSIEPGTPSAVAPPITITHGALPVPTHSHEPLPRLSYTDFSIFEACPKRYWATRVLRMGATPSSGADDPLVFGTAVHVALELHLTNGLVDGARLAAVARAHELSAEYAEELASVVQRFADSATARRLRSHQRLSAEWPFIVPVQSGAGRFAVVGSVDAYGRTADDALIVDHKTGRSGEVGELTERYELQARIYAYAALADGCSRVEVVFIRPQVIDTHGQAQEIRFSYRAEDRASIESQLAEHYAALAGSTFQRRDVWDRHICGSCPAFGSVCDIRKGRGASTEG